MVCGLGDFLYLEMYVEPLLVYIIESRLHGRESLFTYQRIIVYMVVLHGRKIVVYMSKNHCFHGCLHGRESFDLIS